MVTKDKALLSFEKQILETLSQGNSFAAHAFYFVFSHYLVESILYCDKHLDVIKSIYIEQQNLPLWKLANNCNISERTLYRYRKDIAGSVLSISEYLSNNNDFQLFSEVAATLQCSNAIPNIFSHKQTKPVTNIRALGDSYFPVCPNCNCTLEREFQSYCDRCGQRLSWSLFK